MSIDINKLKDQAREIVYPVASQAAQSFLISGGFTFAVTYNPALAITSGAIAATATVAGAVAIAILNKFNLLNLVTGSSRETLWKTALLTMVNFALTKGATTIQQIAIYAITNYILSLNKVHDVPVGLEAGHTAKKFMVEKQPLFVSLMV